MRTARAFLQAQKASAAVEFAFLAPIFIMMILCGAELGRAVAIDRRLTVTTRTVADLTGQYSQMTSTDDTTVLSASAQVMAPYDNGPLNIVLSELSTDLLGVTRVTWSIALNGAGLAKGTIMTMPLGSVIPGSSVIYSQTTYAYTPIFGASVIGSFNMSDQIIMSPRISATVDQIGS